MWNANVFSHWGQTGAETGPASANELHIVAPPTGFQRRSAAYVQMGPG